MYSAFVLPFVLALALGMAAPGALADGFPTTLREAITVRVAEATMSFTQTGEQPATTITIVDERLATTAELRSILLTDSADGDGVPALVDSSPTVAALGSPDGSYADIQAPGTGDGFSEFFRLRGFTHAGQAADYILQLNEAEGSAGSPLLPPGDLIAIASDAGLAPAIIQELEAKYLCGVDVRRRCHTRCGEAYPPPRNEGQGREYAACVRRCTEIERCKPPKAKGTQAPKGRN